MPFIKGRLGFYKGHRWKIGSYEGDKESGDVTRMSRVWVREVQS
jgi:hypothetical protein